MNRARTTRRKAEGEATIRATAERRTGGGPRSIARTLDALIARSGRKRGFGEASLLLEWPAVVGAELAGRTVPDKLVRRRGRDGALLHIRVAAGWAVEVQHTAPAIVERINGFFGYRAVEDLRIVQGLRDRPVRRALPRARAVKREVSESLDRLVASTEEKTVAAALRDLADAVRAP